MQREEPHAGARRTRDGEVAVSSETANSLRQQLLEKYAPSVELRALIEAHKQKIIEDLDFCRSTRTFTPKMIAGIPRFFVKWRNEHGPVEQRIINAEKMRDVINSKEFSLLKVARKYVAEINGEMCLFAEQIPSQGDLRLVKGVLTLDEVKQIVTLIVETGYCDFQGYNILREQRDNKIVFIDTEDRSFVNSCSSGKSLQEGISARDFLSCSSFRAQSGVDKFLSYCKTIMAPETVKWLEVENTRLFALAKDEKRLFDAAKK